MKKEVNKNINKKKEITIELLYSEIISTKDFLQKEISSVKTSLQKEISSTKVSLEKEISSVKTSLQKEISSTKVSLEKEIGELKTDLEVFSVLTKNNFDKIEEKITLQSSDKEKIKSDIDEIRTDLKDVKYNGEQNNKHLVRLEWKVDTNIGLILDGKKFQDERIQKIEERIF